MLHERIYLNENDKRVFIDTYVANQNNVRDALLVIPGGGYSSVCTDREGEPIKAVKATNAKLNNTQK